MGGLYLGPPGKKEESQYSTRLTSNCYSCRGSGYLDLLSRNGEHCYDCRGRGYESEMEAIKVSDGYYLIYYEDRPYQIKAFEIDGLINFLKYWKVLYLRFVGNKIKADYKEMENFYTKCKTKCLSDYKFKSEEITHGIEQYNEASIEILRPRLHPCISDCMGLYHFLTIKYYAYMVKDSGIYAEFVDYKKNIL
jgi:hypothetical protein